MRWKRVHLGDVAATPWRNGSGLTRELLGWPNATQWTLRLSVAEIVKDGPFSAYPDVQRGFAVLSGQGVRLKMGGRVHELTVQSPSFAFDGAAAPDCELIDGPTRDFNLMLRRGSARMDRVTGSHSAACNAGMFVALYANTRAATLTCGRESSELAPNTLAWRILDSHQRIEVISEDALWMEIAP